MLLIASRRRLHGAAAEAIEQEAGDDVGPHLHRLAHHHAEADAIARAVWFERAAAERALGIGAYRQAVECAESGLALLARIPDGPERRRDELALSLGLGAARLVTDGQSAATTRAAYERAAAISRSAPETAEGFRALFGLRTYYLFAGEHATSLRMAEQSLALARRLGDGDLLAQADLMVANARFWVGDLAAAERHIEALGHRLARDRHASHLVGFAQDPRFTALFPSAMTCWLRGNGAQALALVEDGLAEARALEHGFSEAVVLQVLAFLHCLDGRAEPARDAAHELVRVATREQFPVYAAIGSIQAGWAEARLGAPDEGLERMTAGLRQLRAGGVAVGETLIGALLAEAHLTAGRREPGRVAAEEALALALRRRELAFHAELERLVAESLPPGEKQARARAAALATACRQGAHGIERRLRAVTGGAVA
jgi:tetratricopeptide (TPR) repeat protein